MSSRGYHKYVFDTDSREFLGRFEDMYQQEGEEGFDSWFQEDITTLPKQISLTLLSRHNFQRILDIGCGKGTFTHLLKKLNNYVLGIDVSNTAISRAGEKYPDIDFRVADLRDLSAVNETFDLVVAMEVLSYLEHWKDTLSAIARMTTYLYVSLYLPENPIGFVKSFQDLRAEMERHFTTETELVQDSKHIYSLARSRHC